MFTATTKSALSRQTFNIWLLYLKEMAGFPMAVDEYDLSGGVPRSKRDTLGNAFVRCPTVCRISFAPRAIPPDKFPSGSNQVAGAADESRKGQRPGRLAHKRRSHQAPCTEIRDQRAERCENTQVQVFSVAEIRIGSTRLVTSIQRVADTAKKFFSTSPIARAKVSRYRSFRPWKKPRRLEPYQQSDQSPRKSINVLGHAPTTSAKLSKSSTILAEQTEPART